MPENEEQLVDLVRETIKKGLSIELEPYTNCNYNEKGFKLTVRLYGEDVTSDYIYLEY